MLIISYLALAVVIVFSAHQLSVQLDIIDKKTKISGAILGGLLLAAITSLPELITSLTGAIYLDEGALAFGNVWGSNLFNVLIIAGVDIVFFKHLFFEKVNYPKEPLHYLFMMYMVFSIPLLFNYLGWVDLGEWSVSFGVSFNVASLVILGLYILSIRVLPTFDEAKDDVVVSSVKKPALLFSFWAVVVVAASIGLTIFSNDLAETYGLSKSFAGALLLGAATSLPELTTVISLFKLRSYTIALGNIIGSNLFNFLIIALTDFAVINKDIWSEATQDTATLENMTWLLLLGVLNTIILLVALTFKRSTNKKWYYLIPGSMVFTYMVYLWVSI
jgi:cation:H+ antiporter